MATKFYWEVSQIVALPFGKMAQLENIGVADTEALARDEARRVIVAVINAQVEKELADEEERADLARSWDDHSNEHDDASESDMLAAWYANEEYATTQSVTVEDIENREELLDPGTDRERRGVTWAPGWRWEYYTEEVS